MWTRLVVRAVWHMQGVWLWLLQRPGLRWLPPPYPSVGSPEQWRMQAESIVANRAFPRRHYRKALQLQLFSPANLAECCFLRNRMGLELSFLEDPLLMGMMACRAAKGMGSRIKALARQQADQEAKTARAEGRQEAAVRELIGPRGGFADTSQRPLEVGGVGSRPSDRQDDRGPNQASCSTRGARDGQRQFSEEIRSKLKWIGRGEPSKALGTKVSAGFRVLNRYNSRPAGPSTRSQQLVGQSEGKVPRCPDLCQ